MIQNTLRYRKRLLPLNSRSGKLNKKTAPSDWKEGCGPRGGQKKAFQMAATCNSIKVLHQPLVARIQLDFLG